MLASTVASAGVGYIGAQRQAKAMDQQARQAGLMGEYNAQIQKNNAIAAANDLRHQASVDQYNKAATQQQTSDQLRLLDKQRSARTAKMEVGTAKANLSGSSLDDILKAESLLLGEEANQVVQAGAEKAFQFSSQSYLTKLRASREMELGRTGATLSRLEGANQASAYRAQASSARIGGYASLFGGAADSAGIYMKYKKP